jgi:hypothetical protein
MHFFNLHAQERSNLPDGVIHVALPPGPFRIENFVRNKKPLLRVSVGKSAIETRTLFLGDFKGVQQVEATKRGMHWVPAKCGEGPYMDGVNEFERDSTIIAAPVNLGKLKAGSLFLPKSQV